MARVGQILTIPTGSCEGILGLPRSPIQGLVAYVQPCRALAEVVALCNRLMQRG